MAPITIWTRNVVLRVERNDKYLSRSSSIQKDSLVIGLVKHVLQTHARMPPGGGTIRERSATVNGLRLCANRPGGGGDVSVAGQCICESVVIKSRVKGTAWQLTVDQWRRAQKGTL
jgi:hypothetical protein